MYEKHIETLTAARSAYFEDDRPAFDAAIELMRAGEPKGEAAEREHCHQVAVELMRKGAAYFREISTRERAAARAECTAQLVDSNKRITGLEAMLCDAQAEVSELETKLAAAQAQIADLRVCLDVSEHNHKTEERRADELEAKLTNLLAAAERVVSTGDWDESAAARVTLRAAIEASK